MQQTSKLYYYSLCIYCWLFVIHWLDVQLFKHAPVENFFLLLVVWTDEHLYCPSINRFVQNNGNRILKNFEQDEAFDSASTTTSILSTDTGIT